MRREASGELLAFSTPRFSSLEKGSRGAHRAFVGELKPHDKPVRRGSRATVCRGDSDRPETRGRPGPAGAERGPRASGARALTPGRPPGPRWEAAGCGALPGGRARSLHQTEEVLQLLETGCRAWGFERSPVLWALMGGRAGLVGGAVSDEAEAVEGEQGVSPKGSVV